MSKKGLFCCLAVFTMDASATNGINLIGFGAESTLMAGADTAVARDTSALNTNPAGLTQIKGKRYDLYGSLLRVTDLSHEDQFDNDRHASNTYTGLGGMAYAQHIDNTACTAGLGLFAQGGSGGVFEQLNTLFGTKDEFSGLFAVAKLTAGLACEVNDKLSLGGSFGLVYATAEQKIFPDSPAGVEMEDLSSLETSFKLGMQYRVTPKLTLGASYTEKTDLPLTGGKFKINFNIIDLGIVTYNDAKIDGLTLPREIAVGAAYQVNERWLLALKLNWINWSDAMKSTELTAKNPDNAFVANIAPTVRATTAMDWDDQWVIATAAAYSYSEKTTLYAGYNYGKNPIPEQNTNPTMAGIFEHHITFGASYEYSPLWTLYAGIEYDVRAKVDYTNTALPFGEDSQLRNEAVWLHMMVSRQW